MRIAIIGMGPGGEDAPEWERWALLWDIRNRYNASRLFEMHDFRLPGMSGRLEMAEAVEAPIYWQYENQGKFIEYPLSDVIKTIGRDWFDSSIAYMVALAIHEGAEEIGLWGVHMADEKEYRHQRPNLSWLLGLAEGRGIRVHLPDGCALLSRTWESFPVRYGYL